MVHLLVRNDEDALRQLNYLEDYRQHNPDCVFLNPVEFQSLVINRESMTKIFENLNNEEGLNMRCPRSVIINDADQIENELKDFNFPLICKTIRASGGYEAHEMAIIWDVESLSSYRYMPLLAQEYYNHQATIIKVYVCGSKFWMIPGVSLPNFHEPRPPILFNSQDFKKELPEELQSEYAGNLPVPNEEIVRPITERLSNLLGLSIYGYDLIKNIDSDTWGVIDVNYFPDFRGVDGFHEALLDLTKQSLSL
eukprot:TRINITY_DN1951_c0_g1_i2.p1 TRINITY_DN1951_c0_g1~~TRINITY_DN1951_c0_g1_i2.p1  ORF type:complete len:252 (-),score=41.73 TRINITY_DN1951_c0_g1_i2:544-1299(-)